MPIYEYECEKCGKKIEVIQKISDKPLKKHADCGGKLDMLISASGFQFKGTGWYVTDYARKSSGGGAASKESKESSSNGNKEGSSEKSTSDKAGSKDSASKSGKSGSSKE